MPPGYHGQEVLKRCLTAPSIESPEYHAAVREMDSVAGENGLFAVMDQHGLDALVCVREGCHSLANMVGAPIGGSCLHSLSPCPRLRITGRPSCHNSECSMLTNRFRTLGPIERQHTYRDVLYRAERWRTDVVADHGSLGGGFRREAAPSYCVCVMKGNVREPRSDSGKYAHRNEKSR